jgi:hypothetical protein
LQASPPASTFNGSEISSSVVWIFSARCSFQASIAGLINQQRRGQRSKEGKGRAGFSSSPVAVLAVVPSLVTHAAACWVGADQLGTFDFGVSGRENYAPANPTHVAIWNTVEKVRSKR